MADQLFPITITFSRDPTVVTFENAEHTTKWIADEQAFWSRLGDNPNDALGQIISPITRLLNNAELKSKDDSTLVKALNNLAGQYIPSKSGIARIADALRQKGNTLGARAAVCWFAAPQQIGWNNNATFIEGAIAGIAYHSLGSGRFAEEDFKSSVADVEALRAQHLPAIEQFRKFSASAEDDWKKRIEGFEARVALEAPREYWSARAVEHRKLATTAASAWGRWLLAFVAISGIGGLLFFTQIGAYALEFVEKKIGIPIVTPLIPAGSEGFSLLADLLRRALIFGTLLTVGVWWLRQKLRDLRSHEHLAEDAAERVTMIETYAAMKGQGLSANELGLVLAALYRPASTGLVDDAGPTLPFEILMNAAGNVVSRGR